MCENPRTTGDSILSDIRGTPGSSGNHIILEYENERPSTVTSSFTVTMETPTPALSSSVTVATPSPSVAVEKEPVVEVIAKPVVVAEKKKLTPLQLKKVLEVIRHFHGNERVIMSIHNQVKYQGDMIKQGIVRYLRNLFENSQVENDILKTIAYFDRIHLCTTLHSPFKLPIIPE